MIHHLPRSTPLPRRPRLIGASEAVQTPDGRLLILAGSGAGEHVELEHAPAGTLGLLNAMTARGGLDDVAAAAREAGMDPAVAVQVVTELAAAGLLDDAGDDRRWLSAGELDRYDRQLRYFATCDGDDRPRALRQASLRDATVVVLGLGGLGGMAALTLTACGVGHVVGVDCDAVDESNLARQVLFRTPDVGARKAATARRELAALNPLGEFEAIDRRLASVADIAAVVDGADAVVAAIDWPAHRVGDWVDEACFASRVPYVAMSQHPPLLRVGPLYVPGRTGCFACVHRRAVADHPLLADIAAASSDDSPAATYAPACGVIGSLLANELIALLAGLHEPATLGRGWELDLATYASRWTDAVPPGGCARCA